MAIMIPANRPNTTNSPIAEPMVYKKLKAALSDEYTIIHSLPWINSIVKELGNETTPTGEIDFLILHPYYGILALEVKGGTQISYHQTDFIYTATGELFNPITQLRKSTHALAAWIPTKTTIYTRIGYAAIFPQVIIPIEDLPMALLDQYTSYDIKQSLLIDQSGMEDIGYRIEQIMTYWKEVLNIKPLGENAVARIIDCLCPNRDFTSNLRLQISADHKLLQLNPEQSHCYDLMKNLKQMVITGRSGTGKTEIIKQLAQELAEQDKVVLVLTYNTELQEYLEVVLQHKNIVVKKFHSLCREYSSPDEIPDPLPEGINSPDEYKRYWFNYIGIDVLMENVQSYHVPLFDACLIDEGQTFRANWLQHIATWFKDKPILVACDETQLFTFEEEIGIGINPIGIATALQLDPQKHIYTLTVNIRSPYQIFQRLNEFLPSSYQQHSHRSPESETLVEIVTNSPDEALHNLLMNLSEQKVPPEHITLLTTNISDYYAPKLKQNAPYKIGKSTTVYKYRGLESPIIIVYANGPTQDIKTFACAISRATTKCYIIYNKLFFAKSAWGGRAKEIILNAFHTPKHIVEEAEKIGVPQLSLIGSQSIINNTKDVAILWNKFNNGCWIVEGHREKHQNPVTALLWALTILSVQHQHNQSYDVLFSQRHPKYESIETFRLQPINSDSHPFESPIQYTRGRISLCKTTNLWHRHEWKNGNKLTCIECNQQSSKSVKISDSTVHQLATINNILQNPDDYSKSEKWGLPLAALTLGMWYLLSENHTESLLKDPDIFDLLCKPRPIVLYPIIHALIATNKQRQPEISTATIQKHYYQFSTELQRFTNQKNWEKLVSNAFTHWT